MYYAEYFGAVWIFVPAPIAELGSTRVGVRHRPNLPTIVAYMRFVLFSPPLDPFTPANGASDAGGACSVRN
jgi:hypothetical protein